MEISAHGTTVTRVPGFSLVKGLGLGNQVTGPVQFCNISSATLAAQLCQRDASCDARKEENPWKRLLQEQCPLARGYFGGAVLSPPDRPPHRPHRLATLDSFSVEAAPADGSGS